MAAAFDAWRRNGVKLPNDGSKFDAVITTNACCPASNSNRKALGDDQHVLARIAETVIMIDRVFGLVNMVQSKRGDHK